MHEIYIENATENPECLDKKSEELIFSVAEKTLEYEKIDKPCNISVAIVSEDEIRELNSEHRGIDEVTDVLSFPVVNIIDGSFDDNPADYWDGRLLLGDVVICAKRAMEQSAEFGHSYERELGYLCCHSILHLLGYDHEDDAEREIMRQKEEAVMQLLNLGR